MKKILYITFLFLAASGSIMAQPDSELFPDFTFDDLNGETQNLYSYLDDGKIVIIDIFTTWCPNCVSSLPGIEDIWQTYGPSGDDSVMILAFERDVSTTDELEFIADHNITNPVIVGAEELIANTWNIPYQPNFFVVCPDRTWSLRVGGIGNNSSTLTDMFANCESATSVEEISDEYLALPVNTVIETNFQIDVFAAKVAYSIVGMDGHIADTGILNSGLNTIDFSGFQSGMYVIQLVNDVKIQSFKVIKK